MDNIIISNDLDLWMYLVLNLSQ